jgi:hypothetical protein
MRWCSEGSGGADATVDTPLTATVVGVLRAEFFRCTGSPRLWLRLNDLRIHLWRLEHRQPWLHKLMRGVPYRRRCGVLALSHVIGHGVAGLCACAVRWYVCEPRVKCQRCAMRCSSQEPC